MTRQPAAKAPHHHFRLQPLLILLILLATPAYAHSPYLQDDSGWISYNGQEYKLSRWYGDGIFGADPVRSVIVDKEKRIFAVTSIGMQASGFCFSFNYCWAFIFEGMSPIPAIWKFDARQLIAPENSSRPHDNYPNDYSGPITGFTRSYNPLLYPVAWLKLLLAEPILAFVIFALTGLPTALFFKTKELYRYKTERILMRVLKVFLITVFAGASLASLAFLALFVILSHSSIFLLASIALLLLILHYKRHRLTAKEKT